MNQSLARLQLEYVDLIYAHREVLAVWESLDQGKTIERARIEVERAVSNFA